MEIDWKQKARKERAIERDWLFSFSREEAEKLSSAHRYQRMRYEREIEGGYYVDNLGKGMGYNEALKKARATADKIVDNWKECREYYWDV